MFVACQIPRNILGDSLLISPADYDQDN